MMNRIKLCLLALASVALITSSARATVVSAGLGDLILGFRATAGTGAGYNLEVNLGAVSNFYGAAPNTSFALPQLAYQDLIDTYGAGWASRTDLYWGLAASYGNAEPDPNGKPSSTLWVSDVADPVYNRASAATQGSPNTKIIGLYAGGPGSINGKQSTTNSNFAVVIDKTLANSWGYQIGTGNSFAYFNPKIDAAVGSVKTLNFVELQPYAPTPKIPGDKLGTFTLGAEGLTFQAIPEPSTWVLVGCGLGIAAALKRFKKSGRA